MRKLNLIVVFNTNLDKVLFCIRAKEPYKGLYNFVGGKVEENESNDDAAYRELFEETGISNKDVELDHFMDLNYFKYQNNLQVYYGILNHEVNLIEEKNKFIINVIKNLKETIEKWKKETDIIFVLDGHPPENVGHKFATKDKERYGTIKNVTDKGYYTN